MSIDEHEVVSRPEWLEARLRLLAKEKELTKLRDEISAARRALPWVRLEKSYTFEGERGAVTLEELFAGRSQLIVYHFMFDPSWEAGCKSCSFWADNFERNVVHLEHRDTSLVAISRAPLEKLHAFRSRMGWTFPWVSSSGSDFNYDFGVSFTPEEIAAGRAAYNFGTQTRVGPEMPGISVFFRTASHEIFHTYSTYSRGLDMTNAAYHLLDLVPKGRDESDGNMAWLRRRDEYER
ncbi:MAG: DUF899 domain-containing protein [Myxococcales bacterium]|nr:DUF899 domain-containing protein [Myxococcales bacterium]